MYMFSKHFNVEQESSFTNKKSNGTVAISLPIQQAKVHYTLQKGRIGSFSWCFSSSNATPPNFLSLVFCLRNNYKKEHIHKIPIFPNWGARFNNWSYCTWIGCNHRTHTERQWPLSGIHFIMKVKLARGGCAPTPFHYIYHHEQSCGVRVRRRWEDRYTPPISPLPLFPLYPYIYSVGAISVKFNNFS